MQYFPASLIRTCVGACLALTLAACATLVPPPAVSERPSEPPYDAWARVLERYVDDQGRVDFHGIKRDRADLDRFVAWVYENGPNNHPGLFSTRSDVLAFHLNAYNALSMYNVIEAGIPESLSGFRKVGFFYLRKIRVGGEPMSLYDYENEVIRKLGEPRVHFALNCMAAGCPRLPQEVFRAETLDQQLERETVYFLNEDRNVQVDNERRVLRLSEILDFYTGDFLTAAPSLADYVNHYRSIKVPTDFDVEFIPYDWIIHRQSTL